MKFSAFTTANSHPIPPGLFGGEISVNYCSGFLMNAWHSMRLCQIKTWLLVEESVTFNLERKRRKISAITYSASKLLCSDFVIKVMMCFFNLNFVDFSQE